MKIKSAASLSADEQIELEKFEKIIAKNIAAFVVVGICLLQIREKKLYRGTHSTFKTYLEEKWNLSQPYVYRIISSSQAYQNIQKNMPIGEKILMPTAEAQLRYLTHLVPEKQNEVWSKAVKEANGKQPTMEQIRCLVDEMNDKDKSLVIKIGKAVTQKKTEQIRKKRLLSIKEKSSRNTTLQSKIKYPVILIDPCWRYQFEYSENRFVENHYPTMSLDELKDVPIPDIAADDSIIFMWATSPKLAEAMELIDFYGFQYKTSAVWEKDKIGMGYYFRIQHELLLVGTRGKFPAPPPDTRVSSIIRADRKRHSEKPVQVYEIIDRMYKNLPKIEIFSRCKRRGWVSWGNEV